MMVIGLKMQRMDKVILNLAIGKYCYSDRSSYSGDWKANKKEGNGIFYYSNGDKYEGDWKDDKRSGQGITLIHYRNTHTNYW
jgi:hypothetical protein